MMHVTLPQMMTRKERRAREARRGRIGQGRYSMLVRELEAVIRLAFEAGETTSLWGLEGPLRAGLRSDLCLQGWRWRDADMMALEALADAFRLAGATRPSWNEGQREWTLEAGTLIERQHCARCHRELPEGHHKYCSAQCSNVQRLYIGRIMRAREDRAVGMAIRAI